ncbi:hypothetical protein HGI15_21605, partial [Modestobacter lapidis]|nr:hypothetical protein [Modestobacter lapidis]
KERNQARAKKQGYTITIEPSRLTLNGSFIKEGEDFPYCGFPEPYYDITTNTTVPGFEIFFTESYPPAIAFAEEYDCDDLSEKEDWAEKMESLANLFDDTILSIEGNVHNNPSTTSFEPTDTPLTNWSLNKGSTMEVLEEASSVPSDFSL